MIATTLACVWTGCGSSIVDDGTDGLVLGTDSTTEPFEPMATAQDDRLLGPATCAEDTDCNDGDPCTMESCLAVQFDQIESLCEYNYRPLYIQAALAPTVDVARAIALDGKGNLYVAEGPSGVEVFQITSASQLTKIAQVAQPDGAHALDIAAHRNGFVIAMGSAGIQTFRGPPNFAPLVRIDAGSGALLSMERIVSIDVSPGYCLGGGYGDGVAMLNINDLANPLYEGRVNSQGRVVSAALFPHPNYNRAFVADSLLGALVLSFNTPEGVAFIDEISSQGRVEDVAVSGQTGLFSEWGKGFGVADLSNPDDADRLARMPTPTPVYSVGLLGPRTAVVGEKNGVVSFWDLTDGKQPVRLTTWEGPAAIYRLSVVNGSVAVAMGSQGIAVLTTGCEPPLAQTK